ncbi:MAG: EamA family transporter RarD, partial [Prochlorotrichaceae cyanobacterium]
MPQSKTAPSAVNPLGLLYGFLAYGSWGILPIYWKLLASVSALEVLCHRMIWSTLFLLLVLGIRKELRSFFTLFQSPRLLLYLLGTATLLACNWGTYIYAVNIDRVVETSLGYFMTPLLNILLGCFVLRERLSPLQGIAVGLAALGVGNFIWGFGAVPWFALILASSFALYGLCRKLIPVSPLCGITLETLLLAPCALLWLGLQPENAFGSGTGITLLLCLAGVVTSLPLFCFNTAAKLLPLSTLGFLQYLAPSLQLLLGIFLYGEPFTHTHLVSFGLIWTALGLYTV